MTTSDLLTEAQEKFEKIIDHLRVDLSGLQTGRASAALVEHIMVEVYGSMTPLKHVATISIPESRTVAIQAFDRSTNSSIEKAIRDSSLGLQPNSDGVRILLNIPPLTEERRKDLVKIVGKMAEEARISVRNARHDALNTAKRMKQAEEIGEDDLSVLEKKLQEKVDAVNTKIEEMAKSKETEVMKV